MATLEKIRNKSVLLFVIIVVALLAFILGDFLTSGRTYFGSPTTVAKAGGVTVEYQDYQNRLAQAGEQLRNQGRDYSNDQLAQNVVSGLVAEQLLKKEYKELGITVTDKELTNALTGPNMHPAAYQMIAYLSQQLQLPEVSGSAVYDAMTNPAKYGLRPQVGEELRRIWAAQETEMESAMLNEKFMRLVTGLYTYNKLDAKSFYDDNAVTNHIEYVVKDAGSVADDDIEFTDADVEALWKSQKQNYALDEETREVNYIYVPIEPSQSDRIEAQQAVEAAVLALNESEGTQGVANNPRFVVNNVNVPRSGIRDGRLRTFLDEHGVGQAAVMAQDNDTYTIAKLISTSEGIDSINISMLQAIDGTNLDSIVEIVNGGKTMADVSNGATIQGQDSIWVSLAGNNVDNNIKDAWLTAAIGTPTVISDTIQGQPVAQIFKVNRRMTPVPVYEYAVINYTVDPSNATLEKLNTDLRTFLSANSNGEDFSKNAAEAGYSILSASVSASQPHIANVSDSRPAVKWVMDADKGQVSPVIGDNKQTYLMAIAVKDIYKDFIPWNAPSVRAALERKAIANKAGEKLIAEFGGKASDLAGYASLFGGEVSEGDVIFVSPRVATIGIGESEIQGAIAGAPEGKVVGPVAGNNSIVVFEVKSVSDESRPYTFDEYAQRFNRTLGLGIVDPLKMLLGSDKIDNYTLNFVNGIQD